MFVILSAGSSNRVRITECDGYTRIEEDAYFPQTWKLFEKENQRPSKRINITRLNPRLNLLAIFSEMETIVSFMLEKYAADEVFSVHIDKWMNKLKAVESRFRGGVVIKSPTCDSVHVGKSA